MPLPSACAGCSSSCARSIDAVDGNGAAFRLASRKLFLLLLLLACVPVFGADGVEHDAAAVWAQSSLTTAAGGCTLPVTL